MPSCDLEHALKEDCGTPLPFSPPHLSSLLQEITFPMPHAASEQTQKNRPIMSWSLQNF